MTAPPLVRRGAAARRVAWTAFLLALLVPARAVALCCVNALTDAAAAARPHGATHHAGSRGEAPHAEEHGNPDDAELSAESGAGECGSIDAPAPAVRERGPAGGPATVSSPIGPSVAATEPRQPAFRPAPARVVGSPPPMPISLRI